MTLRIIAGIFCLNIAILVLLAARYGMRRCEWCRRRYWYLRSTSTYKWVFCSYKCNYWDLRDHLASNMDVDLAEVEAYLGRHGYVHPDHIKEGTR